MNQLKNFYSKEGVFYDKNDDDLYEGIKGKIYIKKNASVTEKLAAINMLARLSYECTAMSINNIEYFDSKQNIPENSIVIGIDEFADLHDHETELSISNGSLQIISKKESSLKVNGSYAYGRMPYVWNVGKEEKTLHDVDELLKSAGIVGSIDKIIISSEYEGLENVHVSDVSSNISDSAIKELAEKLTEIEMLKKITINSDGKEFIVENKKYIPRMHSTEQNDHSGDISKSVELSDLFSINGIYSDSENDLMNNRLDYKIVVHENISDTLLKAVGNIVVRTALECLELKLDLVKTYEDGLKNVIEIIQNDKDTAKISLNETDNNIIIEGNEESILCLSEHIAKQYPFVDAEKTVQINDLKLLFENILNCKNYQGQIAYLESALEKDAGAHEMSLFADLSGQHNVQTVKDVIEKKYVGRKFEICDYKKEETVWEETYEPEWEVETFENILKNEVYPMLKAGDEVCVSGCLSEEKSIRDELADKIKGEIEKSGAVLKGSSIFSTYKQGFSWITEKVIPELKKCEKVEKIIIKFKPFMPEGCSVWFDENGATPTSAKIMEDDKNRWFDLPIRFLQELYPVDDIIACELRIDRNNIEFKADDSLKDTYEIICYAGENEIYKDTGITRVSERPYLDEFPELGKVHPTTGWITVNINGNTVVDKQVKTDLENIWDFYQHTALKNAKEFILNSGNGKVMLEKQPFFKMLKIEAEISDLDYKLPTRKDLISSLDALHEDLYFVGSDFFKFLGLKMAGAPATEPGQVLPVLKKRNGKGPKVVFSLIKEAYDGPRMFVVKEERILYKENKKSVIVKSIEYENNNACVNIKVDNESFRILSNYADLVNSDVIKDISSESVLDICFEHETSGEKFVINKKKCSNASDKKSLDPGKINTDSLIGYDDYINIMEELRNVKNIKSYVSSKSYQGRDVHVIEIIDEDMNDIVSRAKLINYKPVCLINSRHHANEVSSTNAAFDLVKYLLTDESYKHYVEKLNIVIIPFENPDGGHIHHELQKDNPEWKTHVARFDSLGKDITAEWFNFDTIHTEALAFTKTWYKWLPDVITDNHGVPSHEWDQQFSGYVSPSFKGFWLPRALYYGYFWYITDEEYTKNNVGVCKIIQDKLSDLMNADEEMSKWNFDWADRFEKYAHAWMPKMFPADYYKNLIYYWIPFDTKKTKKYSSHRFPNITSLDWTTEVSDETATGDYLKLCAKTHINGCIAAMDSVISVDNKAEVLDTEHEGIIVLNKKRKRPLYI